MILQKSIPIYFYAHTYKSTNAINERLHMQYIHRYQVPSFLLANIMCETHTKLNLTSNENIVFTHLQHFVIIRLSQHKQEAGSIPQFQGTKDPSNIQHEIVVFRRSHLKIFISTILVVVHFATYHLTQKYDQGRSLNHARGESSRGRRKKGDL